MNTFDEVYDWMAGAAAEFDDPSEPVCQMFFRWVDDLDQYWGEELACGPSLRPGHIDVMFQRRAAIAVPLVTGSPAFLRSGLEETVEGVDTFGAKLIASDARGGIYSLTPSLNLPGVIHFFVVLYNVPQPAPWEQRVILATDASQLATALKVMR